MILPLDPAPGLCWSAAMTPAGSPPPGAGVVRWLRPFVLLLVLLVLDAPAAAPSLAWAARGDGGQPLNRHAVLELLRSPAGHLVVGGTLTRTNGQTAYVVSAFNEQGQPLWRTEHVSTNKAENTLRRLIQDDSGHLLLTGTSDTLKLSPTGQVLWTAPYGGRDVAGDTNGHAYLTGHRSNAFPLLKLDAATGTNVWERLIEDPQAPPNTVPRYTGTQAVAVMAGQNICLLGRIEHYFGPRLGSFFWLSAASYGPDGQPHWFQSRVGGTNAWPDNGYGDLMQVVRLLPAVDGGVVFAINNYSTGWYHRAFSLADTGNLRWDYLRQWPSGGQPGTPAVASSPQGEAVLTGHSSGQLLVFVLGADGAERWEARHSRPGAGAAAGRAVAHDPVVGLDVATGVQDELAWGVTTIATVAYEHATSRELWHQYYPGPVPGYHEGKGVAVDGHRAAVVAGHSHHAQRR
ncbi:MAG TPA: hypothetical protein PKE47_14715, partial [Verrucomicrobiota bacterium]|nr:hypothetical protein [Verrucomicrobiota bacterium]